MPLYDMIMYIIIFLVSSSIPVLIAIKLVHHTFVWVPPTYSGHALMTCNAPEFLLG
jgi:hypothetical protein